MFSCKLTENYDNGDLVGSLGFPELVVQETDALLDLTNLRHQPNHVDYHHPPILFLPMVRPIMLIIINLSHLLHHHPTHGEAYPCTPQPPVLTL